MKRYEKMSKEELVDFVLQCITTDNCDTCKANRIFASNESVCIAKGYLTEEIQMVPRWKTAKTQDDFDSMRAEFLTLCIRPSCPDCKYYFKYEGFVNCVFEYLNELVEVQD